MNGGGWVLLMGEEDDGDETEYNLQEMDVH